MNESLSIGDDVVHDRVCDSLLSSLSPNYQIWKDEFLNKPDSRCAYDTLKNIL